MEPNQQTPFEQELKQAKRGNWLTTAIVIVIVLILAVVIWKVIAARGTKTETISNNQQATTTGKVEGTSTSQFNTVTVSLTDGGFSPASLTINEGDSIQFVNNSSGRMWVASDPYPSNDAYPGFDQKTAGEAGSTYTFRFTKAGRWGFHNQLNPAQTGAVTVFTTGTKD